MQKTKNEFRLIPKEVLLHLIFWVGYFLVILTEGGRLSALYFVSILHIFPLFIVQISLFYIILLHVIPNLELDGKRFVFLSLLYSTLFICLFIAVKYFLDRTEPDWPSSVLDSFRTSVVRLFFLYMAALALYYHKQCLIQKRSVANSKLYSQQQHTETVNRRLLQLKHQFNSHLTFNMLNLLYGRVMDNPKLSEPVILLSSYLRYNLKLLPTEPVRLSSEIEHINNFLSIYTMIHPDLQVNLSVEGEPSDSLYILPRILINYIENALKHGVRNNSSSPVDISIFCSDHIYFRVKNRKALRSYVPGTGTGTKLTKSTLDIFYKDSYDLHISEEDNYYEVRLSLPALFEETPKADPQLYPNATF